MMKLDYFWAMPNKETFQIKGLAPLLEETVKRNPGLWLDPFVNHALAKFWKRCSMVVLSNDLNPNVQADYHLNALDFLKSFESNSVCGVMFDPPYSLRQIKESYEGVGLRLIQHDTQRFYSDLKDEISRILDSNGVCVSFGWNSTGLGRKRGFYKYRLAVINHGGQHNDTIVTWERRKSVAKEAR